jgi:hypothetical protein
MARATSSSCRRTTNNQSHHDAENNVFSFCFSLEQTRSPRSLEISVELWPVAVVAKHVRLILPREPCALERCICTHSESYISPSPADHARRSWVGWTALHCTKRTWSVGCTRARLHLSHRHPLRFRRAAPLQLHHPRHRPGLCAPVGIDLEGVEECARAPWLRRNLHLCVSHKPHRAQPPAVRVHTRLLQHDPSQLPRAYLKMSVGRDGRWDHGVYHFTLSEPQLRTQPFPHSLVAATRRVE